MDAEIQGAMVRALQSVSDSIAHMARLLSKQTAGLQVLLAINLETLLVLMEAKLLTAQQCLDRLTRIRDGLISNEELRPATDLIEALIQIVKPLAEAGYAGADAGKIDEEAQDRLRKLLETWDTGSTKH
jgi:hypothetical protein